MSKRETAAAKEVQRQKLELDPKYIIKLTGTLLGISAVVALLLGVVNQVTAPIIEEMQAEKTAAAMSQVLEAEEYLPLETEAEGVTALYEARTGGEPAGPRPGPAPPNRRRGAACQGRTVLPSNPVLPPG